MNSDDTRETFSIGQLARLTGVGAKAIRFYESIGLLPVPGRGENGYRRYATEDINRVRLLHRMRLLGLPLAVTKPLVAAAAEARCAEIRSELLTLVDRRLVDIDREIAALRASRIEVDRYRRALDTICLNEEEFFRACQDATCIKWAVYWCLLMCRSPEFIRAS